MNKSYVYVIKCDCEGEIGYYVGTWGGHRLETRIYQHFSGNGSRFTRKHKPVAFIKVGRFPNGTARRYEDRLTEYYLEKVGFRRARGGNYLNMKQNCYEIAQLRWWLPSRLHPLLEAGRLGEPDLRVEVS